MYEKYEQRMERLRRVVKAAKIVVPILLGLLAVWLAFFYLVGIETDRLSCPSFEYGGEAKPSAGFSAIGDTVYEYRSIGEDGNGEWTTEAPTMVGKYEVRATSTSVLGIKHEFSSTKFVIRPRELTVTLTDKPVYGEPSRVTVDGNDYSISGTVFGDRIVDSNVTVNEVSSTLNVYRVSDFRAVHADGSDATDCYTLPDTQGEIRDMRVPLTVKAGSKTIKYDGDPQPDLSCDEYEIIGELKEGHTAEFHCALAGASYGLGDHANTIDRSRTKITDAEGNDVAYQYRIEYADGMVSFQKRRLIVQSGSAQKEYDGTPLTNDECVLLGGGDGLAPGDSLDINAVGSQTYPGQSYNYTSYHINSATHGDVSSFYDVDTRWGTLKVTGRIDSGGDRFDPNKIYLDPTRFDISRVGMDGMGGTGGSPFRVFRFRCQQNRQYYFKECSFGDYTGSSWLQMPDESWLEVNADYMTGRALKKSGVSVNKVEIKDSILDHLVYPYQMADDSEPNFDAYVSSTYYKNGYRDYPAYQGSDASAYRDFVYNNYMSVPDYTREVLMKLAEENGLSSDSPTLIEDVADYIQNAASYSLRFPEIPVGEDMVVYFLTTTRIGICQHFASAATMMYRCLGIPARYTIGFTEYGYKDMWSNVMSNHGHAWVEVYLDGTGWVPVEVTGYSNDGSGIGDGGGDGSGGGGVGDYTPNLVIRYDGVYKEYDGTGIPARTSMWHLASYCRLKEGHHIEAPVFQLNAITDAFPEEYDYDPNDTIKDQIRIIDQNGKNVTSEYTIEVEGPWAKIDQRMISITLYGVANADDPSDVSGIHWTITSGSLVGNDSIQLSTYEPMKARDRSGGYYDAHSSSLGKIGDTKVYLNIIAEDSLHFPYAVALDNKVTGLDYDYDDYYEDYYDDYNDDYEW